MDSLTPSTQTLDRQPSTAISSLDSHCSHRQRRSFATCLAILVAAFTTPLLSGCSSEPPTTQAETAQQGATIAAEDNRQPAPEVIVSQFLDRVRRGGDDSNASELLTKLAQQEMTRIGRPLQFPGSPDTTFEVGQSIPVPEEKDSVWVQTFLAEPASEDQEFRYEVVWSLKRETAGWRICGFAIDQGEGTEPLQLDFENGEDMAERLAEAEDEEPSTNR